MKITPVQVASATGIAAGGLAIGALIAWVLKRRRNRPPASEYEDQFRDTPRVPITVLETMGPLKALQNMQEPVDPEGITRIMAHETFTVLDDDQQQHVARVECGTSINSKQAQQLVNAVTKRQDLVLEGRITMFELLSGGWHRTAIIE